MTQHSNPTPGTAPTLPIDSHDSSEYRRGEVAAIGGNDFRRQTGQFTTYLDAAITKNVNLKSTGHD